MEQKSGIIEDSPDKKKAHIRTHLIPKGYEMAVCTDCGLIYKDSRWFYDDELYKRSANEKTTHKLTCPACIKVRDDRPDGIIVISGKFLIDRIDEIKRIALKDESELKHFNPFNRIIKITKEDNNFTIRLTEHKFAERLGKIISRAYSAKLSFEWTEDEDYVEITCHRD